MSRFSRRFFDVAALALMWLACTGVTQAATRPELAILSYHEISERKDALTPDYAVPPAEFERQIAWLKSEGYRFVGIDDILADRAGRKPLPPKAVLLTFDDGYRSVYRTVFPVLKRENAPAVIALVGHWMEVAEGEHFDFDGRMLPRKDLMSWDELREMQKSGLVEIASHSHAMHRGIPGNPQGNTQPAATTLQWLPAAHRYETDAAYQRRVRDDLARNNALIKRELGVAPRIMVWPYGRYNAQVSAIAARLGLSIGLNLDDGPNTQATPLPALRRELVMGNERLPELAYSLRQRAGNVIDNGRPTKAAHIDLDQIYDPDPVQQEKNLGALIERIRALGVNTVYLQAFADADGNGAADAVYFPNRHLPMKADLFNRVAWQISTRTQVKRVYAWMPLLAWQLPKTDPAAADTVVTLPNADTGHLSMGYPRLSPFSARARRAIGEIYDDLGRAATFDGVLFHDDVTLSDYEDASPAAIAQYRRWGFDKPLAELRADDALLRRWSAHKTAWLDDFAMQMARVLRQRQPGLLTARNLYAQVALEPYSETWYSQSLASSLRHYDYTAIMAMPYMEQAPDAKAFYRQLFDRVQAEHAGPGQVVFELQAVDWRKNDAPLPPDELPDTIRMLYDWGVRHIAYYPDNLYIGNPDQARMRKVFDSMPNAPLHAQAPK